MNNLVVSIIFMISTLPLYSLEHEISNFARKSVALSIGYVAFIKFDQKESQKIVTAFVNDTENLGNIRRVLGNININSSKIKATALLLRLAVASCIFWGVNKVLE
ncbi:MAG: hypothetical protein P4L22_07305 [Candidatus Babeliales bacterium]|nr:hypothetical protein [Candidatus Babeliales bacterium]